MNEMNRLDGITEWPYRPAQWQCPVPATGLRIHVEGDGVVVNGVTLSPATALAIGELLVRLGRERAP